MQWKMLNIYLDNFTTARVVINADAPYIKMVSEQFDRCHGTLLQYVEFLTSAVTPAIAYAQLVPTLDEMLHKYHIEPEVIFLARI
jgi:THO complex subunit 2